MLLTQVLLMSWKPAAQELQVEPTWATQLAMNMDVEEEEEVVVVVVVEVVFAVEVACLVQAPLLSLKPVLQLRQARVFGLALLQP